MPAAAMPLFGKKSKSAEAAKDTKSGKNVAPAATGQKLHQSLELLKAGSQLEKYNANRRVATHVFSFDPFTFLISYTVAKGKPPVHSTCPPNAGVD